MKPIFMMVPCEAEDIEVGDRWAYTKGGPDGDIRIARGDGLPKGHEAPYYKVSEVSMAMPPEDYEWPSRVEVGVTDVNTPFLRVSLRMYSVGEIEATVRQLNESIRAIEDGDVDWPMKVRP